VWWSGDGVPLEASVQTMVDSGIYGLKPFVHSDCGGDYRGGEGDLLRWTAHCAFGSVLRFHGQDHRAWTYNSNQTVDVVRSYLRARYKLLPSLIAAGAKVTETGIPFVARGDLFWPDYTESKTNTQYIFLEDLLIAPIWETGFNETSRSVWIPPGDWEDAWNGSIVKGPCNVTTEQPYERQPMWHRRNGSLLVLAGGEANRVDDQDWSTLVLEAFPSAGATVTRRKVVERGSAMQTELALQIDGNGGISLEIGRAEGGEARAWVFRVHLLSGQRVVSAEVDSQSVDTLDGSSLVHLEPRAEDDGGHFPLLGAGAAPPTRAGPVAEIRIPPGSGPRLVEAMVESESVVVV